MKGEEGERKKALKSNKAGVSFAILVRVDMVLKRFYLPILQSLVCLSNSSFISQSPILHFHKSPQIFLTALRAQQFVEESQQDQVQNELNKH